MSVSASARRTSPSTCRPAATSRSSVACSPPARNGKDDDGDGAVDLADAGCSSAARRRRERRARRADDADHPDDADRPRPTRPRRPTRPSPTTARGDRRRRRRQRPRRRQPLQGQTRTSSSANDGDSQGKDRGSTTSRKPDKAPEIRKPDGTPTNDNPTLTVAGFGPAPIGVPNFIIDQFAIPPFLLPIYQACGTQYGIPWEVLASINRIETAFGTNLNVSTAGALGWMQFMPATWETYGVDANNDGRKDPYNPVDAICAAARYLKAAGGERRTSRSAIFAYNHADWYVDEVLLYARAVRQAARATSSTRSPA